MTFRVRNIGNQAGMGRCELLGVSLDARGAECSVPGPAVQLPSVPVGGVFDGSLRWAGATPNGGLRLLCEPGLRS
jgi:hypothetical protein